MSKVKDEFKYGFPADGLAVFFHKWWGSSNPDSTEDPRGDGGKDIQEDKSKGQESVDDGPNVSLIDAEKPHENSETNIDHQGTVLLSRVRRKAAEEGRKVLRLGVYRDSGINKLNRRDRKLLVQIFQSSLPSHLRHGLFES
ncbi:hypothetical protein NMG60_11032729 [Bertholletia excelsa]